jgi:hypothetical protein
MDAEDEPVTTFVYRFGLAYIAAALLTSGIWHLVGFSHFRALVRSHGLLPGAAAPAVAGLVLVLELGAGAVAATRALGGGPPAYDPWLFAASAGLGAAFTLYVCRLLQTPARGAACGCSPIESPLTPAAVVPAGTLLLVGGAGLAAAGAPAGPMPAPAALGGPVLALPVAWGVTLAGLVLLVPAAAAGPPAERQW